MFTFPPGVRSPPFASCPSVRFLGDLVHFYGVPFLFDKR